MFMGILLLLPMLFGEVTFLIASKIKRRFDLDGFEQEFNSIIDWELRVGFAMLASFGIGVFTFFMVLPITMLLFPFVLVTRFLQFLKMFLTGCVFYCCQRVFSLCCCCDF